MDSVLVTEEIAGAGVDLLRERFTVDVELGLPADELASRIGGYDGLIVRSATRVTSDLIDKGRQLRVIGRAGTGVDNVDVAAATRRGIIVANAPGSNMVAAAEHAIGLLLVALARNIPQAHAALVQGRWERRRYAGVELADKTLAVIGFGRIGQLVAARARALGMRVIVHDPFVSAERCRELQVTSGSLENVLLQADFVTLHAPLTDDTRSLINAERLHLMKRGARIVNAARGDLVDMDALVDALESGHVAGAALDVFPEEPYTSGRILELENVVVTPHLGGVDPGGTGQGGRHRRRAGRGGAHGRLRLERREHPARRSGGDGGARARTSRSRAGSGSSSPASRAAGSTASTSPARARWPSTTPGS